MFEEDANTPGGLGTENDKQLSKGGVSSKSFMSVLLIDTKR